MTVPGDPVAKGRPRVSPHGGVYSPRRTKQAEEVLASYAMPMMVGRSPTKAPVGLAVEFYCATQRKSDGDNLIKLVTDALNGVVFEDDSQIVEWFARIHRGVGKDAARTEIFVWELLDTEQ